jgi:hypothetical protein
MEEYQRRKHSFMKELTGDAIAEISKEREGKKKASRSFKVTMGLVKRDPETFRTNYKNKWIFSKDLIKELCKCSESSARAVKIQMEREYESRVEKSE